MGKSFKDYTDVDYKDVAWSEYLERESSSDDAAALVLQPVTASQISEWEQPAEEVPVLPLAQAVFDEFVEPEPRKKSTNKLLEQKRLEWAVHQESSLSVVDEPGLWREELRDSANTKAFKSVVFNYMQYRAQSCVRVANLSDEAGKTQFKPNVAPNRLDFYADVSICVRKAVSPSLYRVWNAFFVLSDGEHAEHIPAHVFSEMTEKAGKRFIQAGIFPVKRYFTPVMVQRKKAA